MKVLGLGTTTISATFAGDDTYKNATVSYELTVVDPNVKVVVFTPGIVKGTQKTSGKDNMTTCLLYTSPSPRDGLLSRMPSSA